MWAFCWLRLCSTPPWAGGSSIPSIFGKANTLAQIAAVAAVLLHQLTRRNGSWLPHVALDATIVLNRRLGPPLRMGPRRAAIGVRSRQRRSAK